jgi:hypothetical protein
MKGNPSLLESEMKSLGDVADSSEALAKIEEKLSPYAKAFGYKPPATGSASPNSSETASITTTIDSDSPGFRPANELSGGEVPPLVQLAPGAWTDDDHRKLRDAVVKKHSALA